jgi:NAD(P)-dependent dehydrogenase (short-subunit alcohol dehydrogenase family)
MERWGAKDIGDLTGRVALVTGANSGLGFVTAHQLAIHGAHVVLACRNTDKATEAVDRITKANPEASLEILPLDLADLVSVRRAAEDFTARHRRLDVLVNNAGIMGSPYRVTADGLELQYASNHFGHFALTGRLLDLLLTTSGSRVVSVSSQLHRLATVDLDDPRGERPANPWVTYGRSKLANLWFTYELDRRLRAAGASTMAVAAHPGWSRSNLSVGGPVMGAGPRRARFGRVTVLLGQSASTGALPTLYAATAPGVQGGQYFGPSHLVQLFGPPKLVRSNRASRKAPDAARFFEISEELTEVHYDLVEAQPTA